MRERGRERERERDGGREGGRKGVSGKDEMRIEREIQMVKAISRQT